MHRNLFFPRTVFIIRWEHKYVNTVSRVWSTPFRVGYTTIRGVRTDELLLFGGCLHYNINWNMYIDCMLVSEYWCYFVLVYFCTLN